MAKTMLGLPSPSFHTALYTRDQRPLSLLLWLFSHSVMSDSFATPRTADCQAPLSTGPPPPRARILEWVAISFSRGSSQPKDQIHISCIGRQVPYHCTTWEAQPLS